MATHHQSMFHYSLERPYPFRWFTPVVTVAGIAAVILFTFINIAADGYTQAVVYTTNPNSTLDEHHWYLNPPWSWISTAHSSCQSPGVSIGSFYYTSNQQTASYTVTNLNTTLGPDEDIVYLGLTSKTLGITTYLNNTLGDCSMTDMKVIFRSQQEPSSATLQIQTGPVYCTIDAGTRTNITLQQSFSGTEFLFEQRSSLSQWSVYSFMRRSYDKLMDAVHSMNSTSEYTGTIIGLKHSGTADIAAPDFFSASILSPGQSSSLISSAGSKEGEAFPLAHGTPENLSVLLDAFAKSYYSAVMWDLNFNRDNAFANETATQYLASAINAAAGGGDNDDEDDDDDAVVPESVLGSRDLAGSAAQFEIQYICSVPRKKDTGSLVIAVAVSNIVLLSVFWNMVNWLALRYLKARDPDWNVCPGCLHAGHSGGGGDRRISSRSNATVMRMDQDPLCQNVDLDQETLYSNSQARGPDPDWKFWSRSGRGKRSFSTKSSKSTLGTLSEASLFDGQQGVREYIPLS